MTSLIPVHARRRQLSDRRQTAALPLKTIAKVKVIVAAIHGILTGQTDASWPDKLVAWAAVHAPDWLVVKKEYSAGPSPRWNNFVRNPRLAKSLVNEILEIVEAYWPGRTGYAELPPIWFIAHSNGAQIAMRAVKLLIDRGFKVAGVILTGAASESDLFRSLIWDWVYRVNRLQKAIAYSSEQDRTVSGDPRADTFWLLKVRDWVWGKLIWPWGSLGRTGWTNEGRHFQGIRVITRWFQGGHSCYFTPKQINSTFETFLQDIKA